MVNEAAWRQLHDEFKTKGLTLVAVSKTKPFEDIKELYALGQQDHSALVRGLEIMASHEIG